MRRIMQVRRPVVRRPDPLDLRTPGGRALPF